MNNRSLLITILIVFSILIAACGPSVSNQTESVGTEVPAPQDSDQTDSHKTLRGTVTTTPETLDPARGSGENDLMIFVNIYETLVAPNELDSSPEPLLATEWSVNPEGTEWTISLREDVKFSDGTPFTANDVKYTFDRLLVIGEGPAYIFSDVIEEVSVLNDYSVKFKLKKPFGPFVSTLTNVPIVNQNLLESKTDATGSYGEHGDYATTYLLDQSAGSGPYVITDFLVHDKMVLEKNPNYWREIPADAPFQVELQQLVESSTTKILMNSQEVDWVHGHQDAETVKALTRNEGVYAANFPESGLNYFMMNTKKPPTDDLHIRKAISYAANLSQMSEMYGGMPEAVGPVPPSLFGHSSDFETLDFDLNKARAEIAESAYASNLAEFPIALDYIQGNGDTGKLIYLLGSELEKLGFKVMINEVPWVQFVNNEAEISTSPNVTNLFATAPYAEAGSILEFKYASWTTGSWNQNEWLQDPTFDEILQEALATVDETARLEKYTEMQRYLVEDVVPSIYTFVSVLKPVFNSAVFQWRGTPGRTPHSTLEYNYYFADFVMN